MASAEEVLARTRAAPATLGGGRLVCIDGPAAAGKTTFADRLTALAPGALLLHTDEMLAGWSGLSGLADTLEALLRPVAAGEVGRWRRRDWQTGAWAEERTLRVADLIVLEGVGSGTPRIADLVTTLVWVSAPTEDRRRRWSARERPEDVGRFDGWAAAETALHTTDRTEQRADVRLLG